MKHRITLLIGILISAASLWWVFSGVDFGEMLTSLMSVHWMALVPSLFFFYLSMYLRAVRWAVFFRPRRELSGPRLFRPVMIGFAFNCILPAHAGEAVRALYVGRRESTGTATAMATIVAERLFDILTLLLCLGAALWFLPPIQPDLEVSVWGITVRGAMIDENLPKLIWGAVFLFGSVSLMLVPGLVPALARCVVRVPGLPERVIAILRNILGGVEQGLAPLKDLRNLMEISVHSLSIWLGVAVSMWTLAFGFPGIRLDFWQSLATMCIAAVFVVVPSAPGYWGLFEAAIVFMLLAMGVQEDKSIATAYAITVHLVQYVPLVIVGLSFAATSRVKEADPFSVQT
jgi:glycosyltransferase 2 family protein